MNTNTDKIKIGLLAVIAVTLVVQTYLIANGEIYQTDVSTAVQEAPPSNMIAGNSQDQVSPPLPETVQSEARPKTTMKFERTEHNFGKIAQDSENRTVFKFTNTGENPLIIEKAEASCGCTVPDYPKEPIAPGKTGEIVVSFKPGKQSGNVTKNVTITANTEPLTTMLFVKAELPSGK